MAATLTSVLVFSTLLVVNQIAYTSENQWLHAVKLAELGHAEAVNSRIFGAAAVFRSLVSAQASLEQAPPVSCKGGSAENFSTVVQLSKSVHGVNYSLNVSMRPVQMGPTSDNLTLLTPFKGFQSGSLNLVVRISMHATAGLGDPYYSKNETHFVHLQVPMALAGQPCPSVSR